MAKFEEDIDSIILSYLDNTLSAENYNRLHQWVMDKENYIQLNQLQDIYTATSGIAPESKYSIDEAWNSFHKKHLEKSETNHGVPLPFYKIAAVSFALIASIAFLYLYKFTRQKTEVSHGTYSEFNVPRGSRSHIYLPDGTSVWLNAESTLRFPQNFDQSERDVFLTGEAYFEVVRNEKLPFIVHAKKTTVKVLGTVFNVKAYPDENFVETTVVKGKVQVSSLLNGKKDITLIANQRVKINSSLNAIDSSKSQSRESAKTMDLLNNTFVFSKSIEPEVYTSWKDSLWIIESEKLKDLAIKMERRYNVHVSFTDTELENYIFSGKLEDETLEQVLQAISVAAPIKYKIARDNVIFLSKE